MSLRTVESEIESIVHDLTLVILRCERLGLTEVVSRIEPIRDRIAEGLRQRRVGQPGGAASGTGDGRVDGGEKR